MSVETLTPAEAVPVAIAELRAWLRIEAGGERDAELGAALRTASEMCEAYLGSVLIRRRLRERIAADGQWQGLALAPVQAIEAVSAIDAAGALSLIPLADHAVDIDGAGRGWVKVAAGHGARRVAVDYVAGAATDWNAIPEPVRHGILRLAAHLRMDGDAAPPASVTALWRPWRAMRLTGGGRR